MVPASVGVQCPDCVHAGARATRQGEGPYGGRRSVKPQLTTFTLLGVNLAVYLLVLLSGGGYGTWGVRLSISPWGSCLVNDGSGRYYPGVGEQACSVVEGAYWAAG